ncbi:MAG: hypothetical protein AB7G52_15135 [Arcobacter sp.]
MSYFEESNENKKICDNCKGTGYVEVDVDDDGENTYQQECCICHGKGYLDE